MKAHEVVARGWTQYTGARDSVGGATYIDEPSAVCWCAEAAINLCYGCPQNKLNKLRDYLCSHERVDKAFLELDPTIAINSWNDHASRTQAEVVGVLKRLDL